MSMIVVKDGVIASDTQMLVNCGTRTEYAEIEEKLHLDENNQFVLGIIGSSVHSIDLALIKNMIRVRLTHFYLGYDRANPLEFSDEETMLLTGYATDNSRIIYLATAEHVWFIKWIKDDEKLAVEEKRISDYNSAGSEVVFANVYHAAGFDAATIIERIARITNTCGGGVHSIDLRKLKKFPREKLAKQPGKRGAAK